MRTVNLAEFGATIVTSKKIRMAMPIVDPALTEDISVVVTLRKHHMLTNWQRLPSRAYASVAGRYEQGRI